MSNAEKNKPKGCTNQSITNGIEPCPQSDISVQVITTESEFDALAEDWTHLHDLNANAGLFNRWYWNRIWWQHYGQSSSLYILVARTQERIIGIAPLYQSMTRRLKVIKANTVQFIGSGGDTSPDDLIVLCHPDYEAAATKAFCQHLFTKSPFTRIRLSDIDMASPLFKSLLESAKVARWNAPLQKSQHRLVDSLPETISEFEKKLSRNARKQRKRRRAKLTRAGNVSFNFCSTADEIDEAFAALISLHQKRFATKGGSDAFRTDRYRSFHLDAMRSAHKQNELKLLTLAIDGQFVGVEYAYLCGGKLSFFQTGFDPEFQHLSIGHVLMMLTIDQAIIDGANTIDLLKGNYDYKKTYAKRTKTTVDVEFVKSKLVLGLLKLVMAVRGW